MDYSVMEIKTIELKKITAGIGMTLTNGEVYSKEVYLGCNDREENWHEIPEGEVPKEPLEEETL